MISSQFVKCISILERTFELVLNLYAVMERLVNDVFGLFHTAQTKAVPDNDYNDVTSFTALIFLQSRPDIRGIIDFARKHSPYYGSLYSNVPRNVSFLQDYPIVDLDSFWKANTCRDSQVVTGPHSGGIVWKTGGKQPASKNHS